MCPCAYPTSAGMFTLTEAARSRGGGKGRRRPQGRRIAPALLAAARAAAVLFGATSPAPGAAQEPADDGSPVLTILGTDDPNPNAQSGSAIATRTPTFPPTISSSSTPYASDAPSPNPTISRQPTDAPTITARPTATPTPFPSATPTLLPTPIPTVTRSVKQYDFARTTIFGLDSLPTLAAFEYWSESTSEHIIGYWNRPGIKNITGPDGNVIPINWPVKIMSVETFDVTQDVESSRTGPGGRDMNMEKKKEIWLMGGGRKDRREKKLMRRGLRGGTGRGGGRQRQRQRGRKARRAQRTSHNTLTYSQTIYYSFLTEDQEARDLVNPESLGTFPFLERPDALVYFQRLAEFDPTADGTFSLLWGMSPVEISDGPFTLAPTPAPTGASKPSSPVGVGSVLGIIVTLLVLFSMGGYWYVNRPIDEEDMYLDENSDGSGTSEEDSDDGRYIGGTQNSRSTWVSSAGSVGESVGSLGRRIHAKVARRSKSGSRSASSADGRHSSSSGQPRDAFNTTIPWTEAESVSNMSLRPFSPMAGAEGERPGGGGGRPPRGDGRVNFAGGDQREAIQPIQQNRPGNMDGSLADTSAQSESTGAFGPHMLMVQDIDDIQD